MKGETTRERADSDLSNRAGSLEQHLPPRGRKRVRMSGNAADDGELALEIEDDGRGYDARAAKKKPGRGVANIRARASMIHADAPGQSATAAEPCFVEENLEATTVTGLGFLSRKC